MAVDLKTERTNVFDLAVPEYAVKRGPMFLPERDIPPQDWARLTARLEFLKNSNTHLNTYPLDLMQAYFLFPERFNLAELYKDEKVQKLMRYRVEQAKNNHNYRDYLEEAMPLRLLFPQSEDNYYHVPLKHWDDLEESLERTIQELESPFTIIVSHHLQGLETLVAFKAIYPADFRQKISSTTVEQNMKKIGSGNFTDFDLYRYMACRRLLFPEDNHRDKINWDDAKNFLKIYSEGDYGLFIAAAFYLKVLAAEKVTLDENGLKIEMKSSPQVSNEPAPMPVERSF